MPTTTTFVIEIEEEAGEIVQVRTKPYGGSKVVLRQALEMVISMLDQEISRSN